MGLMSKLLDVAGAAKSRFETVREQRRWDKLRALGRR